MSCLTRIGEPCRYLIRKLDALLAPSPPVPSIPRRAAPVLHAREQELEAALHIVRTLMDALTEASIHAPNEWDEECEARSADVNAALVYLLDRCAARG